MAVGVEHRHEDQHHVLQGAGRGLAPEHLAQRQEAGVLAVDLAGVDAALDQQHRQAARTCGFGRERAAARGHQRLHRPAFRRGAEVDAAHGIGMAGREGVAEGDDFGIAPGAEEAGALGFGHERGVRRGGAGRRRGRVPGRGGHDGQEQGECKCGGRSGAGTDHRTDSRAGKDPPMMTAHDLSAKAPRFPMR